MGGILTLSDKNRSMGSRTEYEIFLALHLLFLFWSFENCIDLLGKHLVDFCERVRDLVSVEGRLRLAEDFIRSQLQMNYRSYDYTHQTMKLIRSFTGQMIFQQVKEKVPISGRQLQREFWRAVWDYIAGIYLSDAHEYSI